jgi:hypothetical protein
MLINPVAFQFVPVAWAAFCIFGGITALRGLITYPFLSQPWQAAVFVLGLVLVGFVSIEGWWFASQREFHVQGNSLRVRRWLDAVAGRPGTTFDLRELRAASLVIDRGKKLELRVGDSRIQYWAAVWDPKAVRELFRLLEARGVATRADWGPTGSR